MMYKTAVGSFQVGAAFSAPAANIAYFSTLDKGTARLEFRIQDDQGQPLPLSGVKPKLALQMGDKSTFIHDNVEILDPIEGILEYVLSDDEIKHYGQASGELYLVYDDSRQASVHKFSFKIERALIDESVDVIQEYYVKDFELFKKALEDKLAATNAAIDEAKADIAATVQTATTNVNNTAAAATKSINDTATAAKNSVTTTANTAKTDVTNTANSAKSSITSTKTAAETSIAAAVDEGESSLATAAATAKTDVTNTANSAKSSITSTKTSAESSINTAKTQATTAINDLVTSAQGSIKTVSDQVAAAQTNIDEILAAIRNNQLLKKTGDTMTGPLNLTVTDPTPINVKRTGNASNANMKFEHDGATGFIGIDKSGLWKIITGTDANLDGAAAAKFLETTEGAQNKATKAETNAKNASVPRAGGTMSGQLVFENDIGISHKSPSGAARRTIHRGGDDNVYINTDNIGKTIIRGSQVVNKDGKDFETTEGAQSKVKAVTDVAQMAKITADDGDAKVVIANTEDFLAKLLALSPGMHTFYAASGGSINTRPTTNTIRGFAHLVGTGRYGFIFASDYLGNVYTTQIENLKPTGWQKLSGDKDLTWYDLPLVNGAQIYSEAERPRYAIDGKTVWLKGAVKGVTGPLFTVATLPVGFRPLNQDHTFAQSTSFDGYKATVVRWKLEAGTGNLYVHRNSMDRYDSGQWYPIATSFRIDN